jgi:TPP-dependent pyruvate/acetoin dehydrogenase alpha subunit
MARCPIQHLARVLPEEGIATIQQLEDIRIEIARELERAVSEAKRAPDPPVDELARGVYMECATS